MDSAETLTARWILLASEGSRLYQRSCWRNVEVTLSPATVLRPLPLNDVDCCTRQHYGRTSVSWFC